MKKKAPNAVDVYAGSRLRARRIMLGKSQSDLGKAVGVSFQQIQKVECGRNRMGASRIKQLAEYLDVPIAYFFEGTQSPMASDVDAMNAFTASKNGQAIMSAFAKMPPNAQQAMVTVFKLLAGE